MDHKRYIFRPMSIEELKEEILNYYMFNVLPQDRDKIELLSYHYCSENKALITYTNEVNFFNRKVINLYVNDIGYSIYFNKALEKRYKIDYIETKVSNVGDSINILLIDSKYTYFYNNVSSHTFRCNNELFSYTIDNTYENLNYIKEFNND